MKDQREVEIEGGGGGEGLKNSGSKIGPAN